MLADSEIITSGIMDEIDNGSWSESSQVEGKSAK